VTDPATTVAACARCAYFVSAPLDLEAQIPGLRTMSSGFASVLGDDGVCRHHQCLVSARASCAQFAQRGA
jgi:hypothetical protein